MIFPFDILGLAVAIWGTGWLCVRRGLDDEGLAYRSALAFGFGFVSLAVLLGGGGLCGGFRTPVLYLLTFALLVGFGLGWSSFRAFLRRALEFSKTHGLLCIPLGILFLLYGWSSLGPERFVDSLWYHLAVPKHWLLSGRIEAVPFNVPSHYPMLAHLPYVPVLWLDDPWRADVHARLFSILPLLPLSLGVYGVAARHAGTRAGILAATLTASVIWWPFPVIANVQSVLALLTFLAYAELWRWFETRRTRRLVYAAIFMGAACSSKLNALLFGLAPTLVLLAADACARRSLRGVARGALFFACTILWLVPWWIGNAIRCGNPFYPFAESLCPSPEPFHSAALRLLKSHSIAPLESPSLSAWFSGVGDVYTNMVGGGDVLLCMAPFAALILAVLSRREWRLWLSVPLILFMTLTVAGLNAERLISVTHPVLAVVTGVALGLLVTRTPRLRWLYFVALLLPAVSALHAKYLFVTNPGIDWRGRIAITDEAYTDELLQRRLLTPEQIPLIAQMEVESSPGSVYMLWAGYPYHLPGKQLVPDVFFGSPLDDWLREGGEELALQELRERNVSVILIGSKFHGKRPDEVRRLRLFLGEEPVSHKLYRLDRPPFH